jgi:tRNA threonylcarbamoyl adenosine modification protein YeaZ
MIILAIDTSGADCAACIYDSAAEAVLGEVTETIGKGHAERLMDIIDGALEKSALSLDQVGRIAVTIGPGSFTGIRVGVAAARGFALSLGVEAVGVTTLETVAAAYQESHSGEPVAIAFDAKRNEVYLQTFDAAGVPQCDPAILVVDDAKAAVSGFAGSVIGSGAPLLKGAEQGAVPDLFPIGIVARLGSEKPQGAPKPKPLYLRGPDAKPQTGFALERRTLA